MASRQKLIGQYAIMAEVMGHSVILAPQTTNCSAPDTGNMGEFSRGETETHDGEGADKVEVIARFGTPAQKQKYLVPLLKGDIRSSFSMTELGGMSFPVSSLHVSKVILTGSRLVRRYQPQKHDSKGRRGQGGRERAQMGRSSLHPILYHLQCPF